MAFRVYRVADIRFSSFCDLKVLWLRGLWVGFRALWFEALGFLVSG